MSTMQHTQQVCLPYDLWTALRGAFHIYTVVLRPCEKRVTFIRDGMGEVLDLPFDVRRGFHTLVGTAHETHGLANTVRAIVPKAYGAALKADLMRRGAMGHWLAHYAPKGPAETACIKQHLAALREMLDAIEERAVRD